MAMGSGALTSTAIQNAQKKKESGTGPGSLPDDQGGTLKAEPSGQEAQEDWSTAFRRPGEALTTQAPMTPAPDLGPSLEEFPVADPEPFQESFPLPEETGPPVFWTPKEDKKAWTLTTPIPEKLFPDTLITPLPDREQPTTFLNAGESPQDRGRRFHEAVGKTGVYPTNTKRFVVVMPGGQEITTIPDVVKPDKIGEVKDVKHISRTKQLQAQIELSKKTGVPYDLIISKETKTISRPLQRAINRVGGKILEFDPKTKEFKKVEMQEESNKVVR